MTDPVPPRPAVSVIVAARNAASTLERTLACLKRQHIDLEFEVIVVDDGSDDGTLELAERFGEPVRALKNDRPAGAGAARNAGARASNGAVLAFTDADCFPVPEWLQRGLRAIDGIDLVQGAVHADPCAERNPFDRSLEVVGENGYYETANIFVRRELFDSIGGFEDWIVERGGDSPFGWRAPTDGRAVMPARRPMGEDVLFGWRARRRGALTNFAADAIVHHAVFPGSAGEAVRDRWRMRHMPVIVRAVPELRDHGLHRRCFFSRRTAGFDLAVASIAVALVARRPAALIGAVPYTRWIIGERNEWRAQGKRFQAAGRVAEDTATLAALTLGSIAWRSPVL